MGNIISSPMHKLPRGESDDGPPAKRRRISSPDSFDLDHLVASPRLSESGSMLRIGLIKLLHKDSKKVKSLQGNTVPRDVLLTTKARCKVSMFDMSSHPPQVLYCQSQLCDLITFKNPAGPYPIARVDLPQPFLIPRESILINRPDDGTFDLSDSYHLVIELEAADATRWPPLDEQDFGVPPQSLYPIRGTTRHWVMSSRFDSVFGKLRSPLSLSARHPSDQSSYPTNYLMSVDLRWRSGLTALRPLEPGSMPCITAIDPDVDVLSDNAMGHPGKCPTNGMNGHANGASPHDQDDEFAGDQTPSRSLRAREKNKIYNLKVLSDQAIGREKKQRGRDSNAEANEGRVQYVLPSDQPISLDYHCCITCGAYHESMDQLQLHLQTSHPSYVFELETTSHGPLFRVAALREPTLSPRKALQLGRPAKPFSLQTFISGDQNWATSRFGPDGDEVFKSPTKTFLDRVQSGSPVAKLSKPPLRRPVKAPSVSKVLVPSIPQPLFHPISKARLKAGQEVPQNTPDNTWLIQKHRESIADFSDVTAAEKEYIWEWDGYILQQNITSAAYFSRAWMNFVEEKASWLAGAQHRMLEFGKHSSVLLARDVLDDEDMQQAFRYINEARTKSTKGQSLPGDTLAADGRAKDMASTKQSPKVSQIRKGANGCTICQLPVIGPRLLLCSNTTCLKRLYHADCTKGDAVMPVTRPGWLCNVCSEGRKGSD
ncbi:Polycomb protein, VEFS-Box [Metarhizium album ARSEF 1941]|uniref:Polycomb protein, VEFS-Box n=1 Tax=Metarhizium album (strain ARSEF 1941) TaxID=1081103 RepID=A0A0B2WUR7_METAS|nr:Polycomb protein, VEFS-Box [Metarhizium album ARSEF 1941]KHN97813.1 Polycomb protein, VEFS-Box [Metarhizium album ARSEF 1941]